MEIHCFIDEYERGAVLLRRAIEGMDHDQLLARPIPNRWSTMEVICHLADFEPIYADRMKRVIATEQPLLLSAGRDRFVETLAYHGREPNEELALIKLTRRQMVRILRTLGDEAWDRVGIYREQDGREVPRTLLELLKLISQHIPHHVNFISEKRRALGVDIARLGPNPL
jgi:uncharacterized damage-inducible protein DinB